MTKHEKYLYFFSTSIITFFFVILYFYSLKYIVNSWTFSTAHLDYSTGFVRRGLFGEIMGFFNSYLNVKNESFFTFYYIFFTSINLLLFFILIKKLIQFKLIFIFLIFNPALLLFQINDPFAFQRGETIIITLLLLHTLVINLYTKGKLSENSYIKFLILILIPFLFINLLINELQLFLIPFHIFLTINIFYENFYFFKKDTYLKKKFLYISSYIVLIIPILLILKNNTSIEDIKFIYNNISDKTNVNWEPLSLIPLSLIKASIIDSKYMFKSTINIITYSSIIIFFVGSIFKIFDYLKNLGCIEIKNYRNIFFSIAPMFLLFIIARDWGRWISLINYITLLYFLQFPIKKINFEIFKYKKYKNNFTKIFFLILILLNISFIEIPHCCANRLPFGGIYGNIKLFLDVNLSKNVNLDLKLKKY